MDRAANGQTVYNAGNVAVTGMDAVNTWDLALFAAAGYIAVSSLVRLMIDKRNALAVELKAEMEQQRKAQERLEQEKQQQHQPRPSSRRGGRPAA